MPYIAGPDDASLAPAQREMLEEAGPLRPLAQVLAHRPEILAHLLRLVAITFDDAAGLPLIDRLVLALSTARAVGCERLVEAYAEILVERGGEARLAGALENDYRLADLSARQRALLDFAMLVTDDVHLVGKVSVDTMRSEAKLSPAEVVEAVHITALVGYLGRLVVALGLDGR